MKRFTVGSSTVCVVAAVLIVVVAAVAFAQPPAAAPGPPPGQAQGGPAGRGGGFQNMMYLDRAWTALCFGVKVTPDQLTKLTPAFQTAWDARVEIMKKMVGAADFRAAMQEAAPAMQQSRQDLEAKLKEALTPEQLTQLEALLRMGGGPPGGRRQGGGQGGQQ